MFPSDWPRPIRGTGGVEVPESIWPDNPRWVRLVRMLRKPEDSGVGDTVARIAARFGGERFKQWSAKLRIPCGCTDRQAAWNERWPYARQEPRPPD